MGSETYHEPYELLSEKARDMHRALTSLHEELDAIDWYGQRADVCTDAELRAVLLHNREEEIEHAMMVLEWIRRADALFDEKARTYLFSAARITEIEEAAEGKPTGASPSPAEAGAPGADGGLGIGSLKPGGDA